LAGLALLQIAVELTFVLMTEYDEAVRVAKKSQLEAAPWLFERHRAIKRHVERRLQYPVISVLGEY